jgi:hypothetical protein
MAAMAKIENIERVVSRKYISLWEEDRLNYEYASNA